MAETEELERLLTEANFTPDENAHMRDNQNGSLRVQEVGRYGKKVSLPHPLTFPVGVTKCKILTGKRKRGVVRPVCTVVVLKSGKILSKEGGLAKEWRDRLEMAGLPFSRYVA